MISRIARKPGVYSTTTSASTMDSTSAHMAQSQKTYESARR